MLCAEPAASYSISPRSSVARQQTVLVENIIVDDAFMNRFCSHRKVAMIGFLDGAPRFHCFQKRS